MNLKPIQTGTHLETVYVNPEHVTHITCVEEEEYSTVWLVGGHSFKVEGTAADVKNALAS